MMVAVSFILRYFYLSLFWLFFGLGSGKLEIAFGVPRVELDTPVLYVFFGFVPRTFFAIGLLVLIIILLFPAHVLTTFINKI